MKGGGWMNVVVEWSGVEWVNGEGGLLRGHRLRGMWLFQVRML